MGANYGKLNIVLCSSSFRRVVRVHSKNGDKEGLRQVFDEGVDPNSVVDEDGHTAMHYIAKSGHRDCIEIVLEFGGDINVMNNFKKTPLHCACQKKKDSTVLALIKNGADVNAADRFGWTPLHVACKEGCLLAVRHLIAHGAKKDLLTAWLWTSVHVAARFGRSHCLRELLKYQTCIDHIDKEDQSGNTALDLGQIFADKHRNDLNVSELLESYWKKNLLGKSGNIFNISHSGGAKNDEQIESDKSKDVKHIDSQESGESKKQRKTRSTKPNSDGSKFRGKPAVVIVDEIVVRVSQELGSDAKSVFKKANKFRFEEMVGDQLRVVHPVRGWVSMKDASGKPTFKQITIDSQRMAAVVKDVKPAEITPPGP